MDTYINLKPFKTFLSIALAFTLFFVVLSISNDDMMNLYSLIISYLSGLVAIICIYFFLESDSKQIKILFFAIIFFSLRMFVGVIHYLYFFEPDYLTSYSSNFDYLAEYVWAIDSMNIISGTLDGTVDPDGEEASTAIALNKNYEMLFFMSLLFYFGGEKVLVVSSFNSLIVIFSAFLVYKISFFIRQNKQIAFFCFVLVSLQPMEFISSILARDIFGQFLIIFSLYLMISFFNTKYLKYLITLLASLITSFVREVYALIPLITIFVPRILTEIRSGYISKKTLIGFLFLLIFSLVAYDFILSNILYRFLDKDFISLFLSLPVSLVYALVGPFPWTQIFLQPPGYEFHIPQYLTSVYNFTLILSTVFYFLKYKASKLDYLILVFILLFFFSGILVYGGKHTTYYSVAIPLLVLFDKESKLSLFFMRFFLIFMFWVLMNIIYTFIT
ncbi:MAG: hypothetical protein CMD46_00830 [Gammaproteobacteria bacterium]|nr:hypothetical protein [Gammaproteobacteria bacterium]|tara:strand:- start:35396 stop:36730 length:1335 start_codon:yes stop_codon:yes gene_type:complete